MITDTKQKILNLIQEKTQVRPVELVNALGLSQVAIQKQLKQLVIQGYIQRLGHPPLVYYDIRQNKISIPVTYPKDITKIINESYLYVTSTGNLLSGTVGFNYWGIKVNHTKDILQLATQYVSLRQQIDRQITPLGIDITAKLTTTFPHLDLDKVYCLDVYSLPMFGKTKLGFKVLLAKQSQAKAMMIELAQIAHPVIQHIIKSHQLDTVAFIPPTVPRSVQYMAEMKRRLNLSLPHLQLVKVRAGDVLLPQKSLHQLGERLTNAQATIMVNNQTTLPNRPRILLIDDAIGSGATLQQTAKKLINQFRVQTVIGFGWVSSYKGFDIITDI